MKKKLSTIKIVIMSSIALTGCLLPLVIISSWLDRFNKNPEDPFMTFEPDPRLEEDYSKSVRKLFEEELIYPLTTMGKKYTSELSNEDRFYHDFKVNYQRKYDDIVAGILFNISRPFHISWNNFSGDSSNFYRNDSIDQEDGLKWIFQNYSKLFKKYKYGTKNLWNIQGLKVYGISEDNINYDGLFSGSYDYFANFLGTKDIDHMLKAYYFVSSDWDKYFDNCLDDLKNDASRLFSYKNSYSELFFKSILVRRENLLISSFNKQAIIDIKSTNFFESLRSESKKIFDNFLSKLASKISADTVSKLLPENSEILEKKKWYRYLNDSITKKTGYFSKISELYSKMDEYLANNTKLMNYITTFVWRHSTTGVRQYYDSRSIYLTKDYLSKEFSTRKKSGGLIFDQPTIFNDTKEWRTRIDEKTGETLYDYTDEINKSDFHNVSYWLRFIYTKYTSLIFDYVIQGVFQGKELSDIYKILSLKETHEKLIKSLKEWSKEFYTSKNIRPLNRRHGFLSQESIFQYFQDENNPNGNYLQQEFESDNFNFFVRDIIEIFKKS